MNSSPRRIDRTYSISTLLLNRKRENKIQKNQQQQPNFLSDIFNPITTEY